MTGRPSIRRRLVQRLSALYLIALVLSSALFLFRAWSNRIDTLDRSLRQAASGLASTIETRDSARLRIPDSAALALAPAEITFLRYAVADQRSGTVAEGSSQSLLKDLGGRIPEGRLQGGFDFRLTNICHRPPPFRKSLDSWV